MQQIKVPIPDPSLFEQKVFNVVTYFRMFDEKWNDNVKCIKCRKLLLDPVQSSCGCRYCRQCIINHLSLNINKCFDIECEEITSIHTDKAMIREISELEEICPYNSCEFKDKIINLESHMVKCTKAPTMCVKCEMLIFDSEKHVREVCPMGEIECVVCNRLIVRKSMNEHLDPTKIQVCSELMSKCPNQCCEELVKVSAHRQVCTKELKLCPYMCTFVGTRMELNEHMFDNAKEHIQSIITNMEQKMNQLEENLRNSTQQSISDLSIEMHNLYLLKSMSKTIPTAPPIYPICPYIYEIPDFSTKLALAQSSSILHYTSPPFYLFESGYLMSLRVYPNGEGIGLGKYLSVFLVIRKGIYDDKLKWPMISRVNMKITPGYCKWGEGYGNTFKGNIHDAPFQKPISEMNLGAGSPTLMKINKVLSDYLIDGSIFIEIRKAD